MPRQGRRFATQSLLASLWIGAAGCTSGPLAKAPPSLSAAPTTADREARSPATPAVEDSAGRSARPQGAAAEPLRDSPIALVSHDEPAAPGPVPASPEFEPIAPAEAPVAALPAPRASEEGLLPPATHTFSLGNVLYLANAQNPNVAFARERINEAYARVDRAEAMWLPSLRTGMNYNHHEGPIQDVAGRVFNTSRSALYGGFGAGAVGAASPTTPGLVAQFHAADAVFEPKIAEHQASSRQFAAAAERNDVLRDTAVAYLELLRAERALAISQAALRNTERLADLTRQYAETGQGLESDDQRMEAELAGRMNEVFVQVEAVQVASARLAQLLHSDPCRLIATCEPAVAPLEVLSLDCSCREYVATGLTRRPELAEQKHLVAEAVQRMRREKFAPLVPSVLLGVSYGGFGGGLGGAIANTGDRLDADAMAYWEVRNLGAGERAARNETSSVVRQNQMREMAALDQVAREVTEAHAQATQRRRRIELAQRGVQAAERSYTLNQQRIENAQGLPIEVLQSIQALAIAQRNYLNAVVDHNIAQFELCRAVGWFLDV